MKTSALSISLISSSRPSARRGVQADAALAAVGLLDEMVDAAGASDDPGADQAALRVTGFGMLDLDDVGAPVGQHRAGGGDERPGGELDDADPAENVGHSG